MTEKNMNLTLKVWRQEGPTFKGKIDTIEAKGVSPDQSFLEMLDAVNEDLALAGKEPIAFDHDCREGICGMCGCVINGRPHGPDKGTTLCQLHMRRFKDGDTIMIEPWRARAFKVIKDLAVDRSALDKIIQAGGYVSANVGGAQDANNLPIPAETAEIAMDAAACIGCGACAAACPNAVPMLFMAAKVSQLALLPQGKPEAAKRVTNMLRTMDELGFGNCTNHRECAVDCPKEISIEHIARMNREYIKAGLGSRVL